MSNTVGFLMFQQTLCSFHLQGECVLVCYKVYRGAIVGMLENLAGRTVLQASIQLAVSTPHSPPMACST
jgi:hypothetical protein